MVYINVRGRHNSINNKESNSKNKNDDIKNFEKVVYRDERGSIKYKTIKNVYSIRKSKDSNCREIDV